MDISKIILWYRMGLISEGELLEAIDRIDSMEVKSNGTVIVQ
jgi:hypothetical protein